MDDFIGASEAARILGLSRDGFNKLIRRGEIAYERKLNGFYILRRADVEALLAERKQRYGIA